MDQMCTKLVYTVTNDFRLARSCLLSKLCYNVAPEKDNSSMPWVEENLGSSLRPAFAKAGCKIENCTSTLPPLPPITTRCNIRQWIKLPALRTVNLIATPTAPELHKPFIGAEWYKSGLQGHFSHFIQDPTGRYPIQKSARASVR